MTFNYGAVIVTFNRKKKLIKAIESLLKQSIKPKTIIIVDNASTDGAKSFLESKGILKNKSVDFIELKENIGGSGGFNMAFREILKKNVDWVAIGDDDANYSKDYFKKIEIASEKHPDAGGFTSTVRLPDGRIDTTHRFKMVGKQLLRWREIPESDYKKEFNADVFTFVGSVLSVKTIKKVGMPEKDFFIWWDDLDYSIRTHKIAKIINVPGAEIEHDTELVALDSAKEYKPDWRAYYGVRNMYYTFWKNANPILKYPYFAYKVGRTYFNLVTSRFKYNRRYELLVANESLKDFLKGKKGLNQNFLPGSSKTIAEEYKKRKNGN